MNAEKNLLIMKLGEKLVFSDNEGNINDNLSMDFKIEVENDFTIGLYKIYNVLSKKSFGKVKGTNYSVNVNKERYSIENEETKTEYKLDDALILFFQKLKKNFLRIKYFA